MWKGQDFVECIDHQHLTYNLVKQMRNRGLRQQLLLKEYGAKMRYGKGKKKVVEDAVLHQPYDNDTCICKVR